MPRTRHAKRMRSRSVRRSIKRRRSVSRRVPRRRLVGRPRTVSFAPILQEKVRTWLNYVDTKTVAPSTGMANHVFNLANIYDPDVTGIGHQPAFHDQWASYYNKYRVIGARYTVTFRRGMQDSDVAQQMQLHTGTADSYPYILKQDWRDRHILFVETNPTNTFNFTEAADLNFLRETGKKMSGVDWKLGPGPKGTTMKSYVKVANAVWSPEQEDDYTAIGASPSNAVYLNVGAMSKTGDYTNAVGFDIKIQFLVEFSDAKNIGQS